MDYQKIYDDLISRAKSENRKKGEGVYYEAHHILPRCLGGKGNVSCYKTHPNLVLLTAREHFIAHMLLCEIYPNNDHIKAAIWGFVGRGSKKYIKLISARQYERIKKDNAILSSKRRIGVKQSPETIEKLRKINTGRKQGKEEIQRRIDSRKWYSHSEETRNKISLRHIGKIVKPETREKLKLVNTGKKLSEETIIKIKEKLRSEENVKIMRERNLGKKLSEETKKKIAITSLGRKLSEEAIEKLRKINTGKKASEKAKENMRSSKLGSKNNRSKINEEIVLSLRELYDSGEHKITDLCEKFNTSYSTVYQVVNRLNWNHI